MAFRALCIPLLKFFWILTLKVGHLKSFSNFVLIFLFKLAHFQKKSNYFLGFFKIIMFHKRSWGLVRSNSKFGPDRFSRFDVYLIQTDGQTSKVYNIEKQTTLCLLSEKSLILCGFPLYTVQWIFFKVSSFVGNPVHRYTRI